ncbi:aromatic-ring hydroxylase C-terminal domain-containing protein [Actinomadura madurae]|uniref:aromatic-ring hydroxylase C-terminal domain-containing protein n=1 Tax=Actinomadura madurae TaxID=1993 RepID=UPI0035588ED1
MRRCPSSTRTSASPRSAGRTATPTPAARLRAAYEGAEAVLIRPDGYIACTGDATAVQAHLARLTAPA